MVDARFSKEAKREFEEIGPSGPNNDQMGFTGHGSSSALVTRTAVIQVNRRVPVVADLGGSTLRRADRRAGYFGTGGPSCCGTSAPSPGNGHARLMGCISSRVAFFT